MSRRRGLGEVLSCKMKGQVPPVVLGMCAWPRSCTHVHQALPFWEHSMMIILILCLILGWVGISSWWHNLEIPQVVSVLNTVSNSLLEKLNSWCFHCICSYLHGSNLEKYTQSENTTNCAAVGRLQSSLALFSHSQEKASRPKCHLRFLLISTYILLTLLTSLRVCKETRIFPFI